jgi:hypothetical protein
LAYQLPAQDIEFLPTSFTLTGNTALTAGEGHIWGKTGLLSVTLPQPTIGPTIIQIEAKGEFGGAGWPIAEVRTPGGAGWLLGSFLANTATYETYSLQTLEGIGSLGINMINDGKSDAGNTNLHIRRIVVKNSFTTPAYHDSITVRWDPNVETDLAGYRVFAGTASRAYTRHKTLGLDTTAVVTELVVGVKYYFAVTAFDSAGNESAFSNEVSLIAGGDSAPRIAISKPANGQLLLADSIDVSYHTAGDVSTIASVVLILDDVLYLTSQNTSGSFTVAHLRSGTHVIRARLVNAAGETIGLDAVIAFSIRIPDITAPTPPSGVSAFSH